MYVANVLIQMTFFGKISQVHTMDRTEIFLPVRVLSFTMQLPLSSTASQAMMQPCGGIMITSPGTR